MPIHRNQDGTWQWGKSGKKYKKKEDAIRQMKAIFANGYVEKHAALNVTAYNDINNKGSLYMTYTEVYRMIKQAAQIADTQNKRPVENNPSSKSTVTKPKAALPAYQGGTVLPDAPGTATADKNDSVWKFWKRYGTVDWPTYLKGWKRNNGTTFLRQGKIYPYGPF